MFVVDFDGTLLRDDKSISRTDRDAMARLRQRGVITVIATGRSLYSFKKMMAELGMPVTALAVAQHYAEQYPGLLNAFVIDQSDGTLAPDIKSIGIDVAITPTVMKTLEDKQQLARFTLGLMEFQV